MGDIVGSSATLSTWGKFRCVWCLQENYDFTSATDFDITYASGQKSAADGSGLIRWRPRPIVLPYFSDDVQPSIWNQTFTGSFIPPFTTGNRIFSTPFKVNGSTATGYESTAVTDEAKAQLTGETVNFSGGYTTTINNILWTEARYIWNPAAFPGFAAGDVTSIGKLTAF